MVFKFLSKFHGNIENRTVSQIDKVVIEIEGFEKTLKTLREEMVRYRNSRRTRRANIQGRQQDLAKIISDCENIAGKIKELESQENKLKDFVLDYVQGSNAKAEIHFNKNSKKILADIGIKVLNNRGGCTIRQGTRDMLFIPRDVVVFYPSKRHKVVLHIRAFEDDDGHTRGEMLNYDLIEGAGGRYQIVKSEFQTA